MIRHTIRKILREEEETSYWNNDEQWSNDEAMYGPDKGWIPDEQWKKDQNWPQKGDEGGGSDMAESDFDWVESIAPTISFKLLQDNEGVQNSINIDDIIYLSGFLEVGGNSVIELSREPVKVLGVGDMAGMDSRFNFGIKVMFNDNITTSSDWIHHLGNDKYIVLGGVSSDSEIDIDLQ
jgi:hypothetical protein